MGLFRNRADEAPTTFVVPRDIEALEDLANNLESATDEASTWRIFASTYVEFYDMEYGAAWLVENGVPRLEYEVGRIVSALSGTAAQPGLVQQAIRSKQCVYADETNRDGDPR